MPLTPVARRFVLHWGEMGARWGINRTVAQIHALLYISPEPLDAESIADTLNVARSNVSTSLRELQGWHIVRVVHTLGERRDRYESLKDVWEMFQIVLDERKRREIDPTIALLRECVAEAKQAGKAERETRERLEGLLEFFETMSDWYTQIRHLPQGAMIKFVKMGRKVTQMLGVSGK
ncbi:MAG: ArsR family transcriptional regulator [Phycisphaeraceae bacterium]